MTSGLGIDKLLEWVEKIWEWLLPFFVIDHYERGVVLRFGHYVRTVGPGFHWRWPVGIEDYIYENVKPDGWTSLDQSITLKDGVQVTFTSVIVWVIHDVKQLLLEVEDKETVLMVIQGCVQEWLQRYTWEELKTMRAWAAESGKRYGLREKLTKHVNEEVQDWSGVTVKDVLLRDFALTSLKDGVIRVLKSEA